MLLERKPPHFLICLFVRIIAAAFLLAGLLLFVIGLAQVALGDGLIEVVVLAMMLLLSGVLLMRLRSRGLWLFALLVMGIYLQMLLAEAADFWPQFFLGLILLLILGLIFPSYFALRRGEGRRPSHLAYFFLGLLYIALTSLSLAAYYDDAFCTYKQAVPMQSDTIGQSLYVSLNPPVAQWLSLLPCHADGTLFRE